MQEKKLMKDRSSYALGVLFFEIGSDWQPDDKQFIEKLTRKFIDVPVIHALVILNHVDN